MHRDKRIQYSRGMTEKDCVVGWCALFLSQFKTCFTHRSGYRAEDPRSWKMVFELIFCDFSNANNVLVIF